MYIWNTKSENVILLSTVVHNSFIEVMWLMLIMVDDIPLCLKYFNPLTQELNPSAQRCLTRCLLGILLLEPCISLIYA
jgi:hypothetical protein